MIHWQNDLELLYLVDGDAEITSDHQRCTFSPGQIAVINCTCLHSVKAINQSCSYYCLIVGQNYLEQQGIPISELAFSFQIDDPVLREKFQTICTEMSQKLPFYKSEVKSAVLSIAADSISTEAGFSKYYFCRSFKEITGRTVIDYLNLTRCSHAQSLLLSGSCNVSECAEQCGFQNLSYFSKTYRRYMGHSPSNQLSSILK